MHLNGGNSFIMLDSFTAFINCAEHYFSNIGIAVSVTRGEAHDDGEVEAEISNLSRSATTDVDFLMKSNEDIAYVNVVGLPFSVTGRNPISERLGLQHVTTYW